MSGVNSFSQVVPLASGGVFSLVGEPIPPQPEGGVLVIVLNSVTGLIQSSVPIVQGARLELCRNALIGRVVLSSGEQPWKLLDLKARLSKHWMLNSDWRLMSLGRGSYQILLKSSTEMNHVWGFDSVHLRPAIHQDVGGHDLVVVHTLVGSNLISGSISSAGLVLSSNPSSSTVSAISEMTSSSVPPMISQALQISKDSGFDDGVTNSVLVSSSSVVDPSITSVSSAVGVVHYSRTVVQGSSVVNQVRPMVSSILSRSSSRPGHTARRQVKIHEVSGNQSFEEAVVSSASNVNVDQSSLRYGSDSSWASQVEEGELINAEIAQRALRVERRLAASLKSGCRAPSTIFDD
ncbi:hypothetical protein LWI28_012411 [Acer negundo]|uniref:Uncharacterized protein n=1 Tax=Acer negundo TaxID=4023 RepID=A0AAD5JT24_ACENE|nr:hypothetical protein LWI28_012411 [Acer negundo]